MIYIHIGLPKTGTTTLQATFFNRLKKSQYLGVNQPRGSANSKLYNTFFNYSIGVIDYDQASEDIKKAIASNDYGEKMVLSEEMFTVTSHGVSWIEKLERISHLVDMFTSYKIICVIREPAEAALSYYTECYDRYFGNPLMPFSAAIKNSLHMHIYHYDYLFGVLNEYFNEENLKFLSYEDIFSKEKFMCDLFEEKVEYITVRENVTRVEGDVLFTKLGSQVPLPTNEELSIAKELLEIKSVALRSYLNGTS